MSADSANTVSVTARAQAVADERNAAKARLAELHPELRPLFSLGGAVSARDVIGEWSMATAEMCVKCLGPIHAQDAVVIVRAYGGYRRSVQHPQCWQTSDWWLPADLRTVRCGCCERKIHTLNVARLAYCCDRCRIEAAQQRRATPARRKACSECGEQFMPRRSDAITCSDRCRQRRRRRDPSANPRVARREDTR